jgi:hypothetical protein
MKPPLSDRAIMRRLFVASWLVYSALFATNIQREHYPAMALAETGTLRVDAYEPGFHSDIFRAPDGHAYIGNNHGTSVLLAPLLVVFDPILDRLEAREKARSNRAAATSGSSDGAAYDTAYKNRAKLYRLVAERGWTTRFGAVAALSVVFFTAPLCALCVALTYGFLRRRGVRAPRAAALSLLFAIGTPLFFRALNLTNNVPVMVCVFGAFLALESGKDGDRPGPLRHAVAGFLSGLALFCDYSAAVACLVFGLRVVAGCRKDAPRESLARIVAFGVAAAPPILALLWTQKLCYGGWFTIGQVAMPAVNYTDRGFRGFDVPDATTFGANMVDPRFGIWAYAPILGLALIPPFRRDGGDVLKGRAWMFAAAFTLAFLAFCAGNRYSLMQFNTGFRYLLPTLPFFFLAACNLLARLTDAVFLALAVPSIAHAFVVATARDFSGAEYDVFRAWEWTLKNGPRVPWLHVTQATSFGRDLPQGLWPHLVVFGAVAIVAVSILRRVPFFGAGLKAT